MAENMRFAIQSIWSHKMRSFLTMLGVIIGIASIIAIVSTIKGTNEQIMQNLIGAGNNNVTVSLRQGSDEYYMDMGLPQGVHPITDEQKERIRDLDGAADASFYTKRSYSSTIQSAAASLENASIYGIDTHYLNTGGYEVYAGRPLADADYDGNHKVVLLDQTAAEVLFTGGDAVGETIEISGEPFTVVGLIRKSDDFQPVINSYSDYLNYYQEEYGMVMMPDVSWPILYQYDEPENCIVRAKSTDVMSELGREATSIMNESVSGTGGDVSYKAEDLVEKAKNQQELSASTNNLLIWIASIALLVGGIGVMNIMLVSVAERTSEIGLKKALGAKKKRILIQFLTESAMLTSLGGIIGVIAGIILAKVIAGVTSAPSVISIPAIVLGVAFSMVIGIIFGMIPSFKAANLNPVEALYKE